MKRPDPNQTLALLKDFQRDTVDHVFRRMYDDSQPATRYLIADEVGLGKTMVARGIVAKVIDKLWDSDTVKRIDIVYICSSSGIARQNINRLNVTGTKNHPLPDRITLLPRDMKNLQQNKVNFISFTPGTSFNLGGGQGKAAERSLLFHLLPPEWVANKHGALSLLTGWAGRDRFQEQVDSFHRWYGIERSLQDSFHAGLALSEATTAGGALSLKSRFIRLADQLGRREKNLTTEEIQERTSIVGALRGALAAKCIESLEPDLVILDEFQRFRDLLRGGDEAAELARQLFDYPGARVLLLSATPYKMFTLGDEASGDDHYADFVETIGFLQADAARTTNFRDGLQAYRRELFRMEADGGAGLRLTQAAVQAELRRVMVRTERLAVTADRSGMLKEVPATATLQDNDVSSYLDLKRVARAIGHSDVTEFWKSAPYLLNFMDDYVLKEQFTAAIEKKSPAVTSALQNTAALLIPPADIDAYRRIDPANARLRSLEADTIGRNMWQLLWLPPSLPYYEVGGAFADAPGDLTKRLVFSSWQVVPKVVSAMLSYEAERQMLSVSAEGEPGSHSSEARRTRGRRLRFASAEGRLTGMPVLALLYPSLTLATQLDPLIAFRDGNSMRTLAEVRRHSEQVCESLLEPLRSLVTDTGQPDEAWYWAAPLLLDRQHWPKETDEWFGQANLSARWRGLEVDGDVDDVDLESDRAWSEHVEQARELLRGKMNLGSMPDDLAVVIANVALAGPAVTALRALGRTIGSSDRRADPVVRNAAGAIAEGLRGLFNQPDVTVMLRQDGATTAYWRHVLDYGVTGCLQSVLDEYAHVLVEWSGLSTRPWRERATEIAKEMSNALRFRTATVRADGYSSGDGGEVRSEKVGLRSRFAVRYGSRQADDPAQGERDNELRRSFNSPFWPFVLCSTSVGQEGLDFHTYCHAVVHWNLPSNPVDLEQREGRVHRYKGHAVRKNVAKRFGSALGQSTVKTSVDPWTQLFRMAVAGRAEHESDLVPFWVYPVEGGSKIERHIPALPLSRDVAKAHQLRQSLAVYRMAFGQSRQEDMVSYLLGKVASAQLKEVAEQLRIDLSPARVVGPAPVLAGEIDDDLVAEEVENPGVKEVSLRALATLLDEFAATRPNAPTVLSCEAISNLLTAFSRVTSPQPSEAR